MADVNDLRQNIIAMLGLQDLPEPMRIKLVAQMTDLTIKRFVMRLVEALPEDKTAGAQAVKGDPDKLLGYLLEQVPDAMLMLRREAEAVRAETMLAANPEGPIEE